MVTQSILPLWEGKDGISKYEWVKTATCRPMSMSPHRSAISAVIGRSVDFLPYLMIGAVALGVWFGITEGPLALAMLIAPGVIALVLGIVDVVFK